jgi:hypothetical protein
VEESTHRELPRRFRSPAQRAPAVRRRTTGRGLRWARAPPAPPAAPVRRSKSLIRTQPPLSQPDRGRAVMRRCSLREVVAARS